MTTLEQWPAKEAGDIDWAYVSIRGISEAEGVTVVVATDGDGVGVREIEWGRP
jgi:hypothetical protein